MYCSLLRTLRGSVESGLFLLVAADIPGLRDGCCVACGCSDTWFAGGCCVGCITEVICGGAISKNINK